MYNLFINNTIAAIEERLGSNYKVHVQHVVKNNNTGYDGFSIIDKRCENNISPTIPIKRFYQEACAGTTMDDIVTKIINIYHNNIKLNFDVRILQDFEWVKSRICYRLVNTDENREMLKNVPSRKFHDLSIIYFVHLKNFNDSAASVTINNECIRSWNVNEETLYEYAKENTCRFFPVDIFSMAKLVLSRLPDDAISEEDRESMKNEDLMHIVSNREQCNGACVILYPDVLENFAAVHNCNFWLLPSSIHEWIFYLDRNNNYTRSIYEDFKKMITEINYTQVCKEEILNNHPYYYDKRTHKILNDF